MLYIVSTDHRIRLARAVFEARYRALANRVQLKAYSELLAEEIEADATYLLCSVSSFSSAQRRAARLWEEAVLAQQPQFRIVNRPSQIAPWHRLMADSLAGKHRVAETWPLDRQLQCPRFPVVLRQQAAEFSIESPVLEGPTEVSEIVDRMVMAGGSPCEIRAIDAAHLVNRRGRLAFCSLHRIGGAFLPLGEPPPLEDLAQLKALASSLPLEAVAVDFVFAPDGPWLWRIDDELCRMLPDLVGSAPPVQDVARLDALLALDSTTSGGRSLRVLLDRQAVRHLFDDGKSDG